MDDMRIQYLVEQYLRGSLTAAEKVEFRHLTINSSYHEQLKDAFDRLLDDVRPGEEPDEALLPLLAQILERDRVTMDIPVVDAVARATKIWNTVWFRSVAAALVLAIGIATWQWSVNSDETNSPMEIASTILPGGHKAMLTLSDGRMLSLADWAKDTVVTLGGTTILNEDNEGLVYRKVDDRYMDIMNTVSTPNGGQYRVVLADGTKVWLNAASSITFPLNFAEDKRVVKLTGEAYFEVNTITTNVDSAAQKTPFIVLVNDIDVRVLGTRFNINTFGDDGGVRTTLLEGAVQVSKEDISRQIRPGQQVIFNPQSGQFDVSDAAIAHTMAWREGRFDFNGTLMDIMGQISRWYDMEVSFEMTGEGSDKLFIGSISRSVNLDKVLRMIQLTGDVHFKVEENKIIVMD